MRIAIATDGNHVAHHFGRCEAYMLYEVEENEVREAKRIDHPGHRPNFLPRFLSEKNVDLLITGGIGPRAINMFNSLDINVISGIEGVVDDIIKKYLKGELPERTQPCEEHDRR